MCGEWTGQLTGRACVSPQVDLHFMKKIPEGAEASNVLVGELDFLERPIVAFVRLSPAVLLTGLTEVPIPTRFDHYIKTQSCKFRNLKRSHELTYSVLTNTRFLFILLGPDGKAQQYHEIGRSMATIMTDEVRTSSRRN